MRNKIFGILVCSLLLLTGATVTGTVNELIDEEKDVISEGTLVYKLYAVTFHDLEFISIDPSTGVGTYIGDLDPGTIPFGLSDRSSDIYMFDKSGNYVRKLDKDTGEVLESIDIGVTDVTGEGGIAFRSDGLGYLTSCFEEQGKLWKFDILVPSSTYIAAISPCMDGLDFRDGDALYGMKQCSYDEYKLYTIDLTTGATSLVGPTGVMGDGTGLGGLTFAPGDNCFAVLNDNLYSIDACTAYSTLIGPIGFEDVSGLTAVTIPNDPPTAPVISGPIAGNPGISYPYTFTSTDPDGNDVSYTVKWGDGNTTTWTSYQASGTAYSESHTWASQGTYTIEAKAKDIYGAESSWASLDVTMPKNKAVNFKLNIFSRLFERFPNVFPILRQLIR